MPEVILPCPNTKCWAENNRSVLPLRIIGEQSPNNESYRVQCQCGSIGPHGETEAAAIAAWDALPRALTWTHEPPKVADKMYLAKGMNLIVFLVATVEVNGTLYAQLPDSAENFPLSDFVEWAGPIAPPVEG